MADDYDLIGVPGYAEPAHGFQLPGGAVLKTHGPTQCSGEFCCIHNPSDHHMRAFPMNWRGDRQLMERTCPHGVGHPDPDDLAFHTRNGREWQGVHGCDGCCHPPNKGI